MKKSEEIAALEIWPAERRFHTQTSWLNSYHSFSFGEHYDPSNIGHGLLLVSNDDIVAPQSGFGMHPHDNMEIVTWVLEGEIEHKDSAGNHGVIYPGLAQRMSAGQGIWHSEMNPSTDKPVRLIQMWVPPDQKNTAPGYQQADVSQRLKSGEWVAVASGKKELSPAILIQQKKATLWVARPAASSTIQIPSAHYAHLYVARGSVELTGHGVLTQGDAVRLTLSSAQLKAFPEGAEVLLWTSD